MTSVPLRPVLLAALSSLFIAGPTHASPTKKYSSPPKADPAAAERAYQNALKNPASFTSKTFDALYPLPKTRHAITYNPIRATHFNTIAQRYPLQGNEKKLLRQNGFVALGTTPTSTLTPAALYAKAYQQHLPIFISSDSILYALHRSYSTILKTIESNALIQELAHMLHKMQQRLTALKNLPPALQTSAHDVDVYLTVALGLLGQEFQPAFPKTTPKRAGQIFDHVKKLKAQPLTLFGDTAPYDYSQTKPRGHYTESKNLQNYFRAMMWIGRTQAPILTFKGNTPLFNREAFHASYLLTHLLTASNAAPHWETVDLVVSWFVGEHDSMTPMHMADFAKSLNLSHNDPSSLQTLPSIPDQTIQNAILTSPHGRQRIQSQILVSNPTNPTSITLPRIFQLMGQRFVVDSEIFHHMSYDRIKDPINGQKIKRMAPSPLDALFALGSNTAGSLLSKERRTHNISHALHTTRSLVHSYPSAFWDSNLYNNWLHAIRALDDHTNRFKLPQTFQTRAWDHKTLNTQLASWSELRHDTILYAKQSYSAVIACEYPDAYVEPNPLFFKRMQTLARNALTMNGALKKMNVNVPRLEDYFKHFASSMETLETIARKEIEGTKLTQDEMNFLKQTTEIEMVGCGSVEYDGWYPRLFFYKSDAKNFKPTAADVHTTPTDAQGNPIGHVLHVATGAMRPTIITVDHGDGKSHAFIGPTSTYYEHTTQNFTRLDDSTWTQMLRDPKPPSLPTWTQSFSGATQKGRPKPKPLKKPN